MAILQCKPGVKIDRIQAGLAWIIFCLEQYARLSSEEKLPDMLVITSISDGTHLEKSRHYTGEALDLRSKNFPTRESKRKFRERFENVLNNHPFHGMLGIDGTNRFRVLLEGVDTVNEHFHIQVAKGKSFP